MLSHAYVELSLSAPNVGATAFGANDLVDYKSLMALPVVADRATTE